MSREKKVGELMVPLQRYMAVHAGASFKEIVSAFRKSAENENSKELNTVLVYDNNLLSGFISIWDVLKAIEPQFLKGGNYRGWTIDSSWSIPVFWEGLFTDRCIEATSKKARDIMKSVDFELDAGDPLIKAVFGMARNNTENLPVLSDGLVAGIIRSIDLFAEVKALVGTADTPVYTLDRVATSKTAASGQ